MEKQFKDYMNGLKEEVNSEVLDTIEQKGQSPNELFGDHRYPDGVHFKQINGRVQPDDDDDDLDEDEEEDDLILGDEDELDEDDLNEDDIDVEVDDDLDDEDFDEDDLVLGDDDDDDDDEDAI